jgi:hypothetical protein
VTTGLAFRILTTQKYRVAELAPALRYLPLRDQAKIQAKIQGRIDARTGVGV